MHKLFLYSLVALLALTATAARAQTDPKGAPPEKSSKGEEPQEKESPKKDKTDQIAAGTNGGGSKPPVKTTSKPKPAILICGQRGDWCGGVTVTSTCATWS